MDKDAKEFVRIFRRLSQRHSAWSVWRDFIFLSAVAVSNAFDKRPGVWHERENRYLRAIKQYEKSERYDIVTLFALTIHALKRNPCQDFLGTLFMELELSDHWKGQFFTPYCVAEMMARVTVGDGANLKEQIAERGYISMSDPACGGGVTLIAFANVCRDFGIDISKDALFVGQDIDETAALMCYIQLCALDCAGYVTVGNSLTETVCDEKRIWLTPAYFSKAWSERRRKERE